MNEYHIFSFYVNKNLNKNRQSIFIKIMSWVMILAMLNFTSCMNYFKVTQSTLPAYQSIPEFRTQNKIFVFHLEEQAWVVNSPTIENNELICYSSGPYETVLKKSINPEKPNRYKKNSTQEVVLNEVHIYVLEMKHSNNVQITVPVNSIQRIEFCEKDRTATKNSYITGGVGIGLLTIGTVILISILSFNGSGISF